MIDLDLRKRVMEKLGWEAIGYCRHPQSLNGIPPAAVQYCSKCVDNTSTIVRCHLPAIESDPGVSEPMFLEFCQELGIAWSLEVERNSETDEWRYFCHLNLNQLLDIPAAATPSEARARAILAACEAMEKTS